MQESQRASAFTIHSVSHSLCTDAISYSFLLSSFLIILPSSLSLPLSLYVAINQSYDKLFRKFHKICATQKRKYLKAYLTGYGMSDTKVLYTYSLNTIRMSENIYGYCIYFFLQHKIYFFF